MVFRLAVSRSQNTVVLAYYLQGGLFKQLVAQMVRPRGADPGVDLGAAYMENLLTVCRGHDGHLAL